MPDPVVPTAPRHRFRLFEAFGVELEYMIVDRSSLDVRPLAEPLLAAGSGMPGSSTCDRGRIAWSNELAAHVIELKTANPEPGLGGLAARFLDSVREIDTLLLRHDARLLPTAAHPWMDPHRETVLWRQENHEIYECYDRIFGCRGHGWSNLQSMHLNLPFAGDDEFGRLHAAIRLLLPLLPALAASSPILDGKVSPWLDARLEVYRHNQERIPEITGRVIPEPAFTEAHYGEQIYAPLVRAIAPHDPGGVLEPEFLNSRGAIARFDRGSIEIRVLDVQECSAADLAIAGLVATILRALTSETWTSTDEQQSLPTESLAEVFVKTVAGAETAVIESGELLRQFGVRGARLTAREAWTAILESASAAGFRLEEEHATSIAVILRHGTLSSRILAALRDGGVRSGKDALRTVYRALGDCLAEGRMFVP